MSMLITNEHVDETHYSNHLEQCKSNCCASQGYLSERQCHAMQTVKVIKGHIITQTS